MDAVEALREIADMIEKERKVVFQVVAALKAAYAHMGYETDPDLKKVVREALEEFGELE